MHVLKSICTGLILITLTAGASGVASAADGKEFTTGSSDAVIEAINTAIKQGWEDNEISPSDVADDAEWLRRVYLDIVGHIPPVDVVQNFLKDKDDDKRSKVIESLLDNPDFVNNFSTIWTNITVGRAEPRGNRQNYSRNEMRKYFRQAFAQNRPWNEVVKEVITAKGSYRENGAVNYLLSQMQMQDEAVQVTAKTTRIFLGIQVQCTQCHNHPFNDWKQAQFWQFNSFFRPIAGRGAQQQIREYNEETGRMDVVDVILNDVNMSGEQPVFYENRAGVMNVAYPNYLGNGDISPSDLNSGRRQTLGDLVINDADKVVSRAYVNRMWGHFFGYGFTKPVDDMGPHNPPSHPELLDRLTEEFVKSGYDTKQLVRWITNSLPYNLTSRFNSKNRIDNPAAGEMPLFSHMYVKSMEAEQLYDSLLVATAADQSGARGYEQARAQRNRWMQQFVIAFGTDENDEATTFNGTIPQALMMMNGELVQKAINAEKGGKLYNVLSSKASDSEKVRYLFLSTLGRYPSSRESKASQQMVRMNRDKLAAYQDVYWALLNSNEFIFVH